MSYIRPDLPLILHLGSFSQLQKELFLNKQPVKTSLSF